ncbi:hypothetical protein NFI95_12210 [Acetobacteraceae bacterium KSS8]|uniref:Nucleoside phosphorylase domain-containing protein n=1 Tax=Endosaccharibacter trunci TaxID=2812733 RepID=A0ABT1W8J7_9PROT|nr:hypothetical protein [Acetobacteraceae bacterium KSS8]
MTLPPGLGVVVGLATEARLAAAIARPHLIVASGATPQGADAAAKALVARGATHLLSFGFAAGLDPLLGPGSLLLPREVVVDGIAIASDDSLTALFAPETSDAAAIYSPLLHSDTLVGEREEKASLHATSRCASLDMESGAVARVARAAGLPFAVLRTVCDPADTSLPPAARVSLKPDGTLDKVGVARSILFHPAQLPALIRLGRDARRAHLALQVHVTRARHLPGATS